MGKNLQYNELSSDIIPIQTKYFFKKELAQ